MSLSSATIQREQTRSFTGLTTAANIKIAHPMEGSGQAIAVGTLLIAQIDKRGPLNTVPVGWTQIDALTVIPHDVPRVWPDNSHYSAYGFGPRPAGGTPEEYEWLEQFRESVDVVWLYRIATAADAVVNGHAGWSLTGYHVPPDPGSDESATVGVSRCWAIVNGDDTNLALIWGPGTTASVPALDLLVDGGHVVIGLHWVIPTGWSTVVIRDVENIASPVTLRDGSYAASGLPYLGGPLKEATSNLETLLPFRVAHIAAASTLPVIQASFDADAGPIDIEMNGASGAYAAEATGYAAALVVAPKKDWVEAPATVAPACPIRGQSPEPLVLENSETDPAVWEFPVGSIGLITKIGVGLNITHPSVNEVYAELEAPWGDKVRLWANGNIEHDLDLWIVSDLDGVLPLVAGLTDFLGPWTGTYANPERDSITSGVVTLEDFIGVDPAGTWKVRIWDWDTSDLIGTVNSIVLRICTEGDDVLMLVV